MRKLLVHFATDRNGGEFRRISRLSKDVDQKFSLITYEVVFIPITDIFNIKKLHSGRLGKVLLIFPVIFPARRTKISRILSYFLIDLILRLIKVIIKPDILWAETLNGYRAIRNINGYKVIDFHGALPEETLFATNNEILSKEQGIIEEECIINGNCLIMQSDAMLKHLELKYKTTLSYKSIIYNCGVDVDLFDYHRINKQIEREKNGYNKEDKLFIYVGGLHKWQRVYEALDIFKIVHDADKHCRMLLIVQGDTTDLLNYCSSNKIDDIKILQNIDFHEVFRYISISDCAWLLRDDIVLNQVASPTKLGEYLACGQVLITTCVANKWPWLEELNNNILMVDINNIELSASAIVKYISNEDFFTENKRALIRDIAIQNLSSNKDYMSLDRSIILP